MRITRLHKLSKPDEPFRMTKTVNVKLSGDGTNIGKRLHVVNFTFTLLEEGTHAYSYEGNHILVIFKESEKYEQLRMALDDIRMEVEQLDNITVDGISYKVNYFLGGDWKFLALVTGIDSACCRHSCIWCKCPTQERHLTDKQWSLSDVSLGARTIEENMELSRLPKSKKKFNVSHAPLFPTIPLRNVVIDNLHLFLRVADVLVDLLIVELRRQDSATKLSTTVFDGKRYKHLHNFQTFVSSLGIPGYSFWIGQNSKQLKWRTLTGPEKLKVFTHINIQHLLPTMDEAETIRIQVLWTSLVELNKSFSKPPGQISSADIEAFEAQAKQWVSNFIDVYQTKNVTPYIHAMFNHVGEFMRVHGSILAFTQQGLEKMNDVMTKHYFRATSHQNEKALMQIMQKLNRIEHLRDSNACLPKHHDITCSNCKQKGHNMLSCANACHVCSSNPFRAHLVQQPNGRYTPKCSQEN